MRRESRIVWWIIALILCVIGGLLWGAALYVLLVLESEVGCGALVGLGVFFLLAGWLVLRRACSPA